MNKWTVHVTDFGKIKDANIQVKPLTLFIGENNSGKSYLMTLIYGLLNIKIYFESYRYDEAAPAYLECCNVLDRMLEQDGEYVLKSEEIELFNELLNEMLKKNKSRFIQSLFNRKVKLGEMTVHFDNDAQYVFWVSRKNNDDGELDSIVINGINTNKKLLSGYRIREREFDTLVKYHFFLAYIMETMLKKDFREAKNSQVVYFPTARTGFLLTYKTLVKGALEDKFSEGVTNKNLLTRPNSDFLTALSSMSMEESTQQYGKCIEFIEKQLINGRVDISDLPTHDVMYTPKGGKKSMPMYVSSGVVTEMTPLILFLRYTNISTLLIEEPEISLHPELQWQMARVLIRLINQNVPIFVTTHSDIILQHINNMVKLSDTLPDEKQLKKIGYAKEDLLNRADVAVYQFETEAGQKTMVKPLQCGDYGFEAMTFYNTLLQMSKQTEQIESGLE